MPSTSSNPQLLASMSHHTQRIPESARPSTTTSRVEHTAELGCVSDPSKVIDQDHAISSQHAQAPSRSTTSATLGPQSNSQHTLHPQERIPQDGTSSNHVLHPQAASQDAEALRAAARKRFQCTPPTPRLTPEEKAKRLHRYYKQRALDNALLPKRTQMHLELLEDPTGLSDPNAIWIRKGELEELQPMYRITFKREDEKCERSEQGSTKRP